MDNFSETWTVYIIQTKEGKLYTGITKDLARRFSEHQGKSKGARFFNLSEPRRVIYTEIYPNRSEASKRESALKKMSRQEKLKLINFPPES